MPVVMDDSVLAASQAAMARGWAVADWKETTEAPYIAYSNGRGGTHGTPTFEVTFRVAKISEKLSGPYGPSLEVTIQADTPDEARETAMKLINSL